jgi:hypothetical protein
MEQHDAFGAQPELQLGNLAVAAEKPLALLERPRTDEGIRAINAQS